ncbi:transglutaminase-like domain-containing protein [Paenibacillus lactis]|uniref:transglutaminase-like domain-containing protein n=1 Tax=Paenibacillus lactis TaxID=228574 RepID=UPI0036CD25BC
MDPVSLHGKTGERLGTGARPAGHVRSSLISRAFPGTLLQRALITLSVAGLLSEWLLPLQTVNGASGDLILQALALLAAILLLQGLSTWREWVWLPLNALLVIWLCAQLFNYANPLEWLHDYASVILPGDAAAIINERAFTALSEESRTLVLLIGWGIMVSAVHMLSLYRLTVWLFGGSTLVYLAVLASVSERSLYSDMGLAMFYLLMAQGLMHIVRLSREASDEDANQRRSVHSDEDTNQRRAIQSGSCTNQRSSVSPGQYAALPMLRWSMAVIVTAVLAIGAARLGGSFNEPSEGAGLSLTELAERISGIGEHVREATESALPAARMTGYSPVMGDLGGPLSMSDEVFFTAKSPIPTYWRGEAYSLYDGRKWDQDRAIRTTAKLRDNLRDKLPFWERSEGRTLVQTLQFEEPSQVKPLLAGGIISRVSDVQTAGGKREPGLSVERMSETVSMQGEAALSRYTVESLYIQPDMQGLRTSAGKDPSYMKELYLQLPDSLPGRVRDLAKTVTSDASNRYEMVKAIESYLERNYTYTLQTAIPPEGSDFTDQFLFESREGYCAHFATAMTVMLRSEGIPARYVTGFAPGEPVEGKEHTYRVAEKNAHAWVEVFFPGTGWVMFDPTPGFGTEPSTPPATADEITASHLPWSGLWDRMLDAAANVLMLISTLGPVSFGAGLLILVPTAAAAIYCIPSIRERLFFLMLSSRIAVSPREGLVSASAPVWEKIQRRFGAFERGQTVRQYISSLSVTDEAFRLELMQFAWRWERAAFQNEPWTRTEKVHFLRQCLRIVKKLA